MIRCVVVPQITHQLTTLPLKKDPQKVENIRKTAKKTEKETRSLTTFNLNALNWLNLAKFWSFLNNEKIC